MGFKYPRSACVAQTASWSSYCVACTSARFQGLQKKSPFSAHPTYIHVFSVVLQQSIARTRLRSHKSDVCLLAGPFLIVLMNISKVPVSSSELSKAGYSHLAICTLWMAPWNNQHHEPLGVTLVPWSRVLLTPVVPQVAARHRMCCFHPRFSSHGTALRNKQHTRRWQGTEEF